MMAFSGEAKTAGLPPRHFLNCTVFLQEFNNTKMTSISRKMKRSLTKQKNSTFVDFAFISAF